MIDDLTKTIVDIVRPMTRAEAERMYDSGPLPRRLAEPTVDLYQQRFEEACFMLSRAIREEREARLYGTPPTGWTCNPGAAERIASHSLRSAWIVFAMAKADLRLARQVAALGRGAFFYLTELGKEVARSMLPTYPT